MKNLGNYIIPDETINGICVDVGANLGSFTEKYEHHFSKILYIEPQIELFNNLQIRFNGTQKVTGLNKSVWDESDVNLDMVYHSNTDLGSVGVKGDYLNSDWTNNVVNEVKSISLDGILDHLNCDMVDYLKVDCETSEYPFLYEKDLSKIKYIGIELHWHMGEENYNKLIEWIKTTHHLEHGDDTFQQENNKEVLYRLK